MRGLATKEGRPFAIGTVALICLSTVASVVIADRVASFVAGPTGWGRQVVGSFFLLVIAMALFVPHLSRAFRRLWSSAVLQFVIAGAFSLLVTPALARGFSTAIVVQVLLVIPPAVCEEMVFRVALPRSLSRALPRRGDGAGVSFVGCVMAQLLFALCHFAVAGSSFATGWWLEVARLCSAGLLYFTLMKMNGLWLAGGTHAALNADVLRLAGSGRTAVTSLDICLLLPVGLVLGWWSCSAFRSPQRRGRDDVGSSRSRKGYT
jgi:membrane protease YdiL (CAAX protease family)